MSDNSTTTLLTDEQKQAYLNDRGTKCPSCSSESITGDSVTIEEGVATQEVTCSCCGFEWTDIYTLTGIQANI